ncbi:hypothetical protein SAMN05660668_02847 [Pseudobutyrivibrio sp. AR14]|uniref:hypothetical protein n=1 Tax=Pseudobutyrivibrio sp. AR14 TaxID=1520804 RepID=UPI00088AAD31|nr:hypothetical protein [Pseudobutyrivibrio sp. AR14]SCY50297.1 hypothetical protein SAMN05660668_02847 [Pseudobutyrivibrio sp. AR14]
MFSKTSPQNTSEVVANENVKIDAIDSPKAVVEDVASAEAGELNKYGIDVDDLSFSETVSGHINRPYQESKLLIKEIINSGEPIPDPQGTNALYWEAYGTFNGSEGLYELVIDPETNAVWHFVYKSN